MLRSRLLISVLFVAFSLGMALLKPLSSRADEGIPPTPPDPTPPTNTSPIIPPFPAVKAKVKKAKPTRTTQSHLAFGTRVVDYAKRFRGVRYVYGGSSPRSGFDCSGFVRLRLRALRRLPRPLELCAVRPGPPRRPGIAPAGRPRLLRRTRTRRHLHRQRPLHPRTALGHSRPHPDARRLVQLAIRRRPPASHDVTATLEPWRRPPRPPD